MYVTIGAVAVPILESFAALRTRAQRIARIADQLAENGPTPTQQPLIASLREEVAALLQACSSPELPLPSAPRRVRVLVADDNPVNRRVVVDLLRSQGYDTAAVADGREAVRAMEAERFDIVFMDMAMPELSGPEAVRQIRERERSTGTRTPIVALTAHSLGGREETRQLADLDGYLRKPFAAQALYALVEQLTAKGCEAGSELLRKLGGDEALLAATANALKKQAAAAIPSIRSAIRAGKRAAVETDARELRASIEVFTEGQALRAALQLERCAPNGNMEDVQAACDALEAAVDRLLGEAGVGR